MYRTTRQSCCARLSLLLQEQDLFRRDFVIRLTFSREWDLEGNYLLQWLNHDMPMMLILLSIMLLDPRRKTRSTNFQKRDFLWFTCEEILNITGKTLTGVKWYLIASLFTWNFQMLIEKILWSFLLLEFVFGEHPKDREAHVQKRD